MSTKQTVLITGASGGIGLELAKEFARNGHDLVLVARNKQKLDEVSAEIAGQYGVDSRSIAKDLSLPHASDEIYRQLQQDDIDVGILINNAGFGAFGLFSDLEWKTEFELLQVNIVALTHLTKMCVKDMVQRRSGKILNVASMAAFLSGPLMAVYYASKAYVLHFSEAIDNELKGTGVSVSVLCPGPTQTGFQKRADMEDSRLVAGRKIMSARRVAEIGYRGLMSGKAIIIPGFGNKLVAQGPRFVPRSFATKTVREAQERRR